MPTTSFAVTLVESIKYSSKFSNMFLETFFLIRNASDYFGFISELNEMSMFICFRQLSIRFSPWIALLVSETIVMCTTDSVLSFAVCLCRIRSMTIGKHWWTFRDIWQKHRIGASFSQPHFIPLSFSVLLLYLWMIHHHLLVYPTQISPLWHKLLKFSSLRIW